MKRTLMSMMVPAILAANARREAMVMNTFGETMPTRSGATVQRNSLITNSRYICQVVGHALNKDASFAYNYSARRSGKTSFALLQEVRSLSAV